MVLFILPAHTSHVTQILDVSCFGPLKKNIYNSCCQKLLKENPGRVISYDVCQLASKAFVKAVIPSNAIAGFKKTGIYPFNRNVSTDITRPIEPHLPTSVQDNGEHETKDSEHDNISAEKVLPHQS